SKKTLRLLRALEVVRIFHSFADRAELTSTGNEHTSAGNHDRCIRSSCTAFRTAGNDPKRFAVTAGRTAENPEAAAAAREQKIMVGIDGDTIATHTNVRPFQLSDGRNISLCRAIKDVDHAAVCASHRNEDFIVDRIGVQLIRVYQACLQTLNDAN